jgi:hypothetical protein
MSLEGRALVVKGSADKDNSATGTQWAWVNYEKILKQGRTVVAGA